MAYEILLPGKMLLRKQDDVLVILTLFDVLVKSRERDGFVCGIQPCLFVDGGVVYCKISQ